MLLVELRERLDAGDDPGDVKDAGDAASHNWLTGQLAQRRPARRRAVRGGRRPIPTACTPSRLWIIDPLDGTREFGEAAATDWAVHVALVVGGEPVAGAVALPGMDVTLYTGDIAVGSRHDAGARQLSS